MTEIWQLAVVSGLLKLFLRFIKVQAFQVYLKVSKFFLLFLRLIDQC